ncbi:hypothetical protein SDC9_146198 [bioreactor metagenome]|uniref:Uncharacterized protein n=1 Tax=bioreactor metagenome TaxID=1076179 RepID=A0A645ED34_9ZZZZ
MLTDGPAHGAVQLISILYPELCCFPLHVLKKILHHPAGVSSPARNNRGKVSLIVRKEPVEHLIKNMILAVKIVIEQADFTACSLHDRSHRGSVKSLFKKALVCRIDNIFVLSAIRSRFSCHFSPPFMQLNIAQQAL